MFGHFLLPIGFLCLRMPASSVRCHGTLMPGTASNCSDRPQKHHLIAQIQLFSSSHIGSGYGFGRLKKKGFNSIGILLQKPERFLGGISLQVYPLHYGISPRKPKSPARRFGPQIPAARYSNVTSFLKAEREKNEAVWHSGKGHTNNYLCNTVP